MHTAPRQAQEPHHRSRSIADGPAGWSDRHTAAWLGMLQTYRQLTRHLDAELEGQHGLSLSGLELLSRLAGVAERRLRLSTLSDQIGLSVSGVSRLVDTLEEGASSSASPAPRTAGRSTPG